jgi:uncharacterized protein
MPIIDCHVHLNAYDKINKQEGKLFSLEEMSNALLQSMDNNNVDYSVIISSYRVNDDRPSTSQILDIIKRNDNLSNRVGVVAGFTIDNHTDEDLKNYRQWMKDGLIIGVKLYCGYEHYYPCDERYQRVYDMCIEYGCPVMIHTGDVFSSTGKLKYAHPMNVDDIAVDNPELKIVMCHLGNPWIIDCQQILYKNRNVYADISGLVVGDFTLSAGKRYMNQVKDLLDYIGQPHSLLYGSDWPISNMHSYLAFVRGLELEKESYDLLMYKNTKHIFGL